MNTYDFDQTIFNPDSSYAFTMYCMRRFPKARKTIPGTSVAGIKYLMKKIRSRELKEQIFSFLKDIPDIDSVVLDFWDHKRGNLNKWYLEQRRADDIIISASPEFLLSPICEELGVSLIGTRMDKHTGKIEGMNCHGQEKVRRFFEAYPDAHTEKFYSDSLTDEPMARIADEAFLVKKGKLSPWPII